MSPIVYIILSWTNNTHGLAVHSNVLHAELPSILRFTFTFLRESARLRRQMSRRAQSPVRGMEEEQEEQEEGEQEEEEEQEEKVEKATETHVFDSYRRQCMWIKLWNGATEKRRYQNLSCFTFLAVRFLRIEFEKRKSMGSGSCEYIWTHILDTGRWNCVRLTLNLEPCQCKCCGLWSKLVYQGISNYKF